MRRFEPGTVVNLYQEDWHPFQNLPAACRRFGALTGVTVNLGWDPAGLGHIETMWDRMERSFTDDDPSYDLVCADEVLLRRHAVFGRVRTLDDWIAAEGYALDDFAPAQLDSLRHDGRLLGLPCVNVTNLLMYRADLFERHGVAPPTSLTDIARAALEIQSAVRAAGQGDFYGFTSRGAAGAGYMIWPMLSSWAPSFGATCYDRDDRPTFDQPAHVAALDHYVDLLRRAGPPEQPEMTFVEMMQCYEAGRAAMIVEVGMEYAHSYGKGGPVAAGSRCMPMPAGPIGRCHAGLYCPPYAIPARSKVGEAAWELAKFLCSPEQLREDALVSNAIETSRASVLADPRLDRHFRPDLLGAVRDSRAISRGERPFSRHGLALLDILGHEYNQALRGRQTAAQAMAHAQQRIAALGPRW